MIKYSKVRGNQQGVVAIFSVLVIMGILTLLTIAFSNITRQAQRRTLDDHLSNQAFYAAESGIDLAVANINNYPELKNDCGPTPTEGGPTAYDVDASNNIAISCLRINKAPVDITYSSVPTESSGGTDGYMRFDNPVNTIGISWSATVENPVILDDSSSANAPNLYPAGSGPGQWGPNHVGVVRVDLIPVDNSAILGNRVGLVDSSYSFYLYPSTNASATTTSTVSSGTAGPDGHGKVIVTRCDNSSANCGSTITLSGLHGAFMYRLTSIYNPSRVTIQAGSMGGTGGTVDSPQNIRDGQIVVDSTGRANDVFKRLQVRLPIRAGGFTDTTTAGSIGLSLPSYAVFAEDVCKRYVIEGPTVSHNNSATGSCQTRPTDP